jgi:AcrR family transcriptional regulator
VYVPARDAWRDDGGVSPRVQIAEIQRSRLLSAAVRAMDEDGYGDTTVAHITSRARVSRRTFYELFDDREDCLIAVLEHALGTVEAEIAAASPDAPPWRERVRGGLWAILAFFERDRALARVCTVQALHGGQSIMERRTQVLARLASVIDEGRREGSRGVDAPSLTAEGLVGAANGIVQERLLNHGREPLTVLLGPLMAMIVLPYLGPAAARREQARPAPEPLSEPSVGDPQEALPIDDPLASIPMRVTYRTARVLEYIAEQPGVSNRMVGEHAGIPDQGQISKLLSRLERLGLAANRGEGHVKGEPNAWTLTPKGERVAQSIRSHTGRTIPSGESR